MSRLLSPTRLRLHRIDHMPIHGGALFIQLRHKDSDCPPDKSVTEMLMNEDCGLEAWREFEMKAYGKIGALASFVDNVRTNGKTVVGYGASAKSTVWINACKFTRKHISFITDTTAEKLYRFIPGSDIPIVDEGALTRELPDYAICFCWNYLSEVLEKEKLYLAKGGKFIVPHPEIKVIP
jgi:methylation protein EvaC